MTDPTIAARLAGTVTPPIAAPAMPPVVPPAAPPAVPPVAPLPAPIQVTPPASGTPTAPVSPIKPGSPLAPGAPGTAPSSGNQLSDLVGGWQVTPSQITKFASAVQQVRSDLDTVFRQVNQLTSPAYLPQLGSSPVGQALTQKFVDRLSGGQGLLSNLSTVLSNLDQFVANAEQAAAAYNETEQITTDSLKSL